MWKTVIFSLFLFLNVNPVYSKGNESSSQDISHFKGLKISNEKVGSGKTGLKAIFRMKAGPDVVYKTLRDVRRFPEFMPYAQEVRILKSGPGYNIIQFLGGNGLFKTDIIVKQVFDDADRRISWSLVKGNTARAVEGFWDVEKDQSGLGSLVTYLNYVNVGTFIPDFITRYYLKNDINHMVRNLRKRVNSGGTWKSEEYLHSPPNENDEQITPN